MSGLLGEIPVQVVGITILQACLFNLSGSVSNVISHDSLLS